jgi:hypothetical protein
MDRTFVCVLPLCADFQVESPNMVSCIPGLLFSKDKTYAATKINLICLCFIPRITLTSHNVVHPFKNSKKPKPKFPIVQKLHSKRKTNMNNRKKKNPQKKTVFKRKFLFINFRIKLIYNTSKENSQQHRFVLKQNSSRNRAQNK